MFKWLDSTTVERFKCLVRGTGRGEGELSIDKRPSGLQISEHHSSWILLSIVKVVSILPHRSVVYVAYLLLEGARLLMGINCNKIEISYT